MNIEENSELGNSIPPVPAPPKTKPPPVVIIIEDSEDDMQVEKPPMPENTAVRGDMPIEEGSIVQLPPPVLLYHPAQSGATKPEPQPVRLFKMPSERQLVKEPCIREIKSLNPQLMISKQVKRRECGIPQQRPDTISLVEQFIPQDLVILDHVKIKDAVLIGQRYQAQIKPSQREFYHIPNPANQVVWRSSNGFDPAAFKSFQEMFGERRTTEELCLLLARCGGSWTQLPQILQHYRRDLKKYYSEIDSRQ